MNKPLQAVITDLDGSLLSNGKDIGAADLATIAKLKAMGIPFFIATGRHQAITRPYAKQIGVELPVVTSNGGLLYDFSTETVLTASLLQPSEVEDLKAFSLLHNLFYFIYSDTQCFLNDGEPNDEFFKMDMALMDLANEGEFEMMGPGFEPNDHKVLKFMMPNLTPELYDLLMELPCVREGRVEPTYSGNMFVDINPAGISKGSAAEALSRQYGFSLEHTLALGDNTNDTKMLEAVGYPVVPETAHPDMRKLARFVTCSNNDSPITYAINALFPGLLK